MFIILNGVLINTILGSRAQKKANTILQGEEERDGQGSLITVLHVRSSCDPTTSHFFTGFSARPHNTQVMYSTSGVLEYWSTRVQWWSARRESKTVKDTRKPIQFLESDERIVVQLTDRQTDGRLDASLCIVVVWTTDASHSLSMISRWWSTSVSSNDSQRHFSATIFHAEGAKRGKECWLSRHHYSSDKYMHTTYSIVCRNGQTDHARWGFGWGWKSSDLGNAAMARSLLITFPS